MWFTILWNLETHPDILTICWKHSPHRAWCQRRRCLLSRRSSSLKHQTAQSVTDIRQQRCLLVSLNISSSYRGSSPEPSSKGFPPPCTSSCDPVSSARPVCPVTAPRACHRSWAGPVRSLPPPLCCPAHRESPSQSSLPHCFSKHRYVVEKCVEFNYHISWIDLQFIFYTIYCTI